MSHAPLIADALSDEPHLRCNHCGSVDFHSPDLAMQWADPYTAHLAVTCATCRRTNHVRLAFRLGRVSLIHRSTSHAEL